MKTTKKYILSHKNETIFEGSERKCYLKLHNSQSNSIDWAMKYEGWEVIPTDEDIVDEIQEVEFIKTNCDIVYINYNGEEKHINKRYVSAHVGLCEKGDQITINTDYIY